MAYFHGVKVIEQATELLPSAECHSGIPVAVGVAPINTGRLEDALKPQIAYSRSEAIEKIGYSEDTEKYPLSQVTKAAFELYQVAPVVYINVCDPTRHVKDLAEAGYEFQENKITLEKEGVLADSIRVASTDSGDVYEKGRDYTLSFDDRGYLVIQKKAESTGGTIVDAAVLVSGKELDPTKVTAEDVVRGIEKIREVYPRFGVVPGTLLAPGFSHLPEVYLSLVGKADNLNGKFKCFVAADLDTAEAKEYSQAAEWKNGHNFSDKNSIVLWPNACIGMKRYYLSVLSAVLMAYTDSQYEDTPCVSPSNKALRISGLCLKDGSEVILDEEQANHLNAGGIVTATNEGGWRLWGDRTAAYPFSTDVKDVQISVRRMFNWQSNRFIQTYRQKVDDPADFRTIETIVDSENLFMAGLKSKGYIAGGNMEFRLSDNPATSLLDGHLTLRQHFSPYPAAEVITNIVQYDPDILLKSFE